MDTGSYMAGQMDQQIENSKNQYDDFCEKLEYDITEFISESGYSWTAIDIFTEYREKYKKGFYVSYTCNLIIKKFEERLKLIY